MSIEQEGHQAIEEAVKRCKPPIVVVEMLRQFGDVLHSTIVVRHLRAALPGYSIIWAIESKYVESFKHFTLNELGPHTIASLPASPAYPEDGLLRKAWVTEARKLPGVVRAFGCGVHPWGWPRGSIVDAVLLNAEIEHLLVPRSPWIPVGPEDWEWSTRFIQHYQFTKFVTLEYLSYSLKTPTLQWMEQLIRQVRVPVIALASRTEPLPSGAVDGRGTTFRQAKVLMHRSSCFIGVGSGLTVLAAANNLEDPVVELTTPELSMPAIGYRRDTKRYRSLHGASPQKVAVACKELLR